MVALSCGIDADTFGSLMTLASGRCTSSPSSARSSLTRCSGVSASGKVARTRPDEGDVAQLDLHAGDVGEGVDHRQQRPRGQRRGLVGVRVDDGVTVTRHDR